MEEGTVASMLTGTDRGIVLHRTGGLSSQSPVPIMKYFFPGYGDGIRQFLERQIYKKMKEYFFPAERNI